MRVKSLSQENNAVFSGLESGLLDPETSVAMRPQHLTLDSEEKSMSCVAVYGVTFKVYKIYSGIC